jgi:hypothetical protein
MLRQLLRILVAIAWALICVFIAAIVLVIVFGQMLDRVPDDWGWLAAAGQIMILITIGIASFLHAMRGSARPQKGESR